MKDKMLYYDTLINSLVFSLNIKDDLKLYCEFFNNNRDAFLYIFERLGIYIANNKTTQNKFDIITNNNFYEIILYLYSNFPYEISNSKSTDRKVLNDFFNTVKIYLANCSDNNCDYIREQILIRDYALTGKFNFIWPKLKKTPDFIIEEYKGEYYKAISNDILVMNLLNESKENFYNNDYEAFLLNKDFYRSINYFILTSNNIALNADYLERISYIINNNLNALKNYDGSFDLDDEFFDIHNATQHLLKKKIK